MRRFNANGTLASLSGETIQLAVTGSTTEETVQLSPTFGTGAQPTTLDLGAYGKSTGVTQFAGTDYQVAKATKNGYLPGSFTNLTANTNGNLVANYSNGLTFADANARHGRTTRRSPRRRRRARRPCGR